MSMVKKNLKTLKANKKADRSTKLPARSAASGQAESSPVDLEALEEALEEEDVEEETSSEEEEEESGSEEEEEDEEEEEEEEEEEAQVEEVKEAGNHGQGQEKLGGRKGQEEGWKTVKARRRKSLQKKREEEQPPVVAAVRPASATAVEQKKQQAVVGESAPDIPVKVATKTKKKKIVSKKMKKSDEIEELPATAAVTKDEDAASAMSEGKDEESTDDSDSVRPELVLNEHQLRRKVIVPSMKGRNEARFHFQLNERWSVYSDTVASTKGSGESFSVVSIARKAKTAAPQVRGQATPGLYKMSIPYGQVANIYMLLTDLINEYKPPQELNMESLKELAVGARENEFNFARLREHGYPSHVLIAAQYSARVGWVTIKKAKKASQTGENIEVPRAGAEDETTMFLALVLSREIKRTAEELEKAKSDKKKLSSCYSIDIPISLIRKLHLAFAFAHKLNGGMVEAKNFFNKDSMRQHDDARKYVTAAVKARAHEKMMSRVSGEAEDKEGTVNMDYK